MVCYSPIQGWRSRSVDPVTGRRPIVFKRQDGFEDLPVKVPCNGCVGCRLERSRQWAVRCTHEAQMHDRNCFITLTYNNEHLPESNSVDVREFQLFMKKLRYKFGAGIRFFHCGEYGKKNGRPHYHAILFGMDFDDRRFFTERRYRDKVWRVDTSETLDKLWGKGFTSVGECTFESAAYVARYILKKVTGEMADNHYTWICPETGEVFRRSPEYVTMSRRPGIGAEWYETFTSDVFPHDRVIMDGKRMRPPKYYDELLEVTDENQHRRTKAARKRRAAQHKDNNTPERLAVREYVQMRRMEALKKEI